MKKIIVMLLVLALGLTGCGNNKENSKADATDVSSQTEDGVQEEETKIPEQVDITDFDKSGILEPQVLYDGDDMTFELSDFQYDDYFVGLQFHAVSKLDFPVTVDIASFALMGTTINGYTIEQAASMSLSPEEPERYEWCYYSYMKY